MMTNLFSIFDPSTPNFMSMNWLTMFIMLLVNPLTLWVLPNRNKKMMYYLTDYIFTEFKPLVKKTPFVLIMIISLFIFIMFNNLMGLMPFIFTPTSHLSLTFSIALPFWLALMIFGWLNNTTSLLTHLIPQGTPSILMPFMVIIETISNLIRPGTLAVRLTANMIAGHLLIVLLSSATPFTPLYAAPLLITAQMALSILEIAVSFIQAYVMSVLITLYTADFTM